MKVKYQNKELNLVLEVEPSGDPANYNPDRYSAHNFVVYDLENIYNDMREDYNEEDILLDGSVKRSGGCHFLFKEGYHHDCASLFRYAKAFQWISELLCKYIDDDLGIYAQGG